MYQQTGTGDHYLEGDSNPEEFSWENLLTPSDLLNLLQRNGKIRKACSWVSREAIRPRFQMLKDQSIKGTKFGQEYMFANVVEYLEWIGVFEELEKGYTWSRLFGTAILVLFKEGEVYDGTMFLPLEEYDSCAAYYPLAGQNGYQIVATGTQGDYFYQITFTNLLGNQTVYKVHKDRVITLNAPHLELTWKGSSAVEPMAKLAIVQEQMFRSVMQRLHFMGAGVAVMQVNGEDEKKVLDASVSKSFKYLDKIYTTSDPKTVMEMYVPNLNASQFREIWDIAQEEIATDMNMSKKLISGDPQGTQSSAKWDTEISYTEVYQTQRHYKKPTEQLLFKLGIPNTTFVWNDPFPTEQTDKNNPSSKEDSTKEDVNND